MTYEDDSLESIKRELTALLLSDRYRALVDALGNYAAFTEGTVYDHERTRPPGDFPACELIAVSSHPGESSAQGYMYDNGIYVLITASGKDEGEIVRHLQALILAARRLFKEAAPLLPTTGPMVMGRELYAALQAPPSAPRSLVKSAVLRLTVPTYADQVS